MVRVKVINILIINGPNLNLLGKRDQKQYGSYSLEDIQVQTNQFFKSSNTIKNISVQIEWFQSNSESRIINKVQMLYEKPVDCLIINPAAFTHSSIAIFDSLIDLNDLFKIEVHLSNTNSRENFRQNKITTKAVDCVIEGYKELSYIIAINSYLIKLNKRDFNGYSNN